MTSEVVVRARVCDDDGEPCRSDVVLGFSGSKIDQCTSFVSSRGARTASGSLSWTKEKDIESCRINYLMSRSVAEDASHKMNHGMSNGSVALISESEGKHVKRRVGKEPRNGCGSFRKPRMLQTDNVLLQAENDDSKIELDMHGSDFVKCSNADKSPAVKQRNYMNGRQGDGRNSKAPMKAKFDPFSLKAGLPCFSPAAGVSNAFGRYGLKPDVHDFMKLMEDISLDELLEGTYKCPTYGKDKGKRTAYVNDNVLDSVRKVCSLVRLQGMQQGKQTEDVDLYAIKETPSSPSPFNNSVGNGSDGDGGNVACFRDRNHDWESCAKGEASADLGDSPLYQPGDILERLALPPPKDLESLLQEAVKPSASTKLTDSRSGKQLSRRVSLSTFPWSHNFNGHHKSNNDALKTSSKSTCFGRWVRISSTASFIGGRAEGFMDLDSLTYDDSLVPAGQLKYRLPEVESTPTILSSQRLCQQDVSAASRTSPALHPPKVLAAARTLCNMASQSLKRNSSGVLKWPKQSFQKAMKARKSRLNEIPEEEIVAPKSETVLGQIVRNVEYLSSSKKAKSSLIKQREDYRHVQATIGVSISAPRSNRSSPSILSQDTISEARRLNSSFVKSSFLVPPPPSVLDWSNQNPQTMRKIEPVDWNRMKN